MIFEEEHGEEEEQHIEYEEIVDKVVEKNIPEVQTIQEITLENEDQKITIGEGLLNPSILKSPPSLKNIQQESPPPKKVKIGGYFGQEISVKAIEPNENLLSSATETIISEAEGSTQVKEQISITKLRPPRRSTIKLCKICGFTLRGTSNCPKCGFKN